MQHKKKIYLKLHLYSPYIAFKCLHKRSRTVVLYNYTTKKKWKM